MNSKIIILSFLFLAGLTGILVYMGTNGSSGKIFLGLSFFLMILAVLLASVFGFKNYDKEMGELEKNLEAEGVVFQVEGRVVGHFLVLPYLEESYVKIFFTKSGVIVRKIIASNPPFEWRFYPGEVKRADLKRKNFIGFHYAILSIEKEKTRRFLISEKSSEWDKIEKYLVRMGWHPKEY